MEVYIPGISITGIGYTITTIYHLFLLLFAIAGLIGTDATFITLVLHSFPLTDLFKNAVTKLEKDIATNEEIDLKSHVKNILKMHQNMNM